MTLTRRRSAMAIAASCSLLSWQSSESWRSQRMFKTSVKVFFSEKASTKSEMDEVDIKLRNLIWHHSRESSAYNEVLQNLLIIGESLIENHKNQTEAGSLYSEVGVFDNRMRKTMDSINKEAFYGRAFCFVVNDCDTHIHIVASLSFSCSIRRRCAFRWGLLPFSWPRFRNAFTLTKTGLWSFSACPTLGLNIFSARSICRNV